MSEDEKNTSTEQSDDSGSPGAEGTEAVGISDDQLPEDLQPTDDNPLAKAPSDDDGDEKGISLGPDGPEA